MMVITGCGASISPRLLYDLHITIHGGELGALLQICDMRGLKY